MKQYKTNDLNLLKLAKFAKTKIVIINNLMAIFNFGCRMLLCGYLNIFKISCKL